MPDSIDWPLFFVSAIAINLAPGPDLIFILSRTLKRGLRAGLAASAGVCMGAIVHVLAAAAGVSALLAASERAFTMIRWAGAAYLAWLGASSIFSARSEPAAKVAEPQANVDAWATFREGVLVDVLNPKVSLFFLAFLPQFVRPGTLAPQWQVLVLGLLVIAVAMLIEALLVLVIAQSHRYLARPGVSRGLDALAGLVLLGLAAQLALGSA